MDTSGTAIASKLLDSFIAGDLAAALSTIHPDCVVHESPALPYPGDWHGPDGFNQLVSTMVSLFELTFDRYEVIDNGDTVSMRAYATFTSRTSGRSVDTSIVEIYRFQDGQIVDADIYYKDPTAIRDLQRAPAAALGG
ncbi:MAG TPA: nuclear transport factor 2 family protein [Pseudonocardia sp.]|jgi:ketosteroid isomerase-like protein